MNKDRRLYGKFTLDFWRHPKIVPLSSDAFRCLVEATLWSRENMTDGFLARRLAVRYWSASVLLELCQNDPRNPSLIEVEDGWKIRDFAEHQDTKAEIEARREQAKLAGQLGGLTKAKRTAKRSAKRSAKQNPNDPLSKMLSRDRDILTTPYRGSSKDFARSAANGARNPDDEKLTRQTCPRCDDDGLIYIDGAPFDCTHPAPEELYPDER